MSDQQTRIEVTKDQNGGQQFSIIAQSGNGATFTAAIPRDDQGINEPTPDGPCLPCGEGSISDSRAVREALGVKGGFYDKATKALTDLKTSIGKLQGPDMEELKDEFRISKSLKALAEGMAAVDKTISDQLERAQNAIKLSDNVYEAAKSIRQPQTDIGKLNHTMSQIEIRRIFDNMSEQQQAQAIADADTFTLDAIQTAPLSVVKSAENQRRINERQIAVAEHAFPWMKQLRAYHEHIMSASQARATEVATMARAIVDRAGLKNINAKTLKSYMVTQAKERNRQPLSAD